jgi:recombination protein RecA
MAPAAATLANPSAVPAAGARASLEALLRERKLDRTLTTAQPFPGAGAEPGLPFRVAALDARLMGGIPRGQVSEVVGAASSGRTTLVWRWVASATQAGLPVALIDTLDRFDPASAAACGVDLDRLLWVRGQAISRTPGVVDPAWLPGVRAVGGPGTLLERAVDRALKALNLVLQSGVCPVVVVDLADVPTAALRRIPYPTWLRVQRLLDGSDTTCVILGPEPLARSAGGVTLTVQPPDGEAPRVVTHGPRSLTAAQAGQATVRWAGAAERSRRMDGLAFDVRVASSRRQIAGRVTVRSEALVDRAFADR